MWSQLACANGPIFNLCLIFHSKLQRSVLSRWMSKMNHQLGKGQREFSVSSWHHKGWKETDSSWFSNVQMFCSDKATLLTHLTGHCSINVTGEASFSVECVTSSHCDRLRHLLQYISWSLAWMELRYLPPHWWANEFPSLVSTASVCSRTVQFQWRHYGPNPSECLELFALRRTCPIAIWNSLWKVVSIRSAIFLFYVTSDCPDHKSHSVSFKILTGRLSSEFLEV